MSLSTLIPQPPPDWSASIHLLARLHPPAGVVHVGEPAPGSPSRVWQGWGVEHAVCVQASQAASGESVLATVGPLGWQTVHAVLGASAQEGVDFHLLSLQTESGLLSADSLRPVWPNVQTVSITPHAVDTLDHVLAAAWLANAGAPDWLWVDTWPSVAVLQGAEHTLRNAQVVVVRVALPPADQGALQECSYTAAHECLTHKGFVAVSVIESRHPMVGWALFVRDSAAPLRQLEQQLERMEQQLHQLEKEKADLIAENDAVAHEKVQLLKLRDNLTAEKDQLAAAKTQAEQQYQASEAKRSELESRLQQQHTQLDAAKEAAKEASDQASSQAAQQLEQLERMEQQLHQLEKEKADLIAENDAVAHEKVQLLKLRDNLTAEKDQLAAAKTQAEQQYQASEAKRSDLENGLNRIQTQYDDLLQRQPVLEADNQDLAHRQQLLQEELVKAEAQIELIKDLLLREPGL